jgi:hypothetical protein
LFVHVPPITHNVPCGIRQLFFLRRLTIGSLYAQSAQEYYRVSFAIGRKLGIVKPHEEKPKKAREKERGERFLIEVCGRAAPATNTDDGIRAVQKSQPIDPNSVKRYLEDKFGENLKAVQSAMKKLAKSYKPQQLAHDAYALYERFRPDIPAGKKGWGAKGDLDLGLIGRLAKEKP